MVFLWIHLEFSRLSDCYRIKQLISHVYGHNIPFGLKSNQSWNAKTRYVFQGFFFSFSLHIWMETLFCLYNNVFLRIFMMNSISPGFIEHINTKLCEILFRIGLFSLANPTKLFFSLATQTKQQYFKRKRSYPQHVYYYFKRFLLEKIVSSATHVCDKTTVSCINDF